MYKRRNLHKWDFSYLFHSPRLRPEFSIVGKLLKTKPESNVRRGKVPKTVYLGSKVLTGHSSHS